MAGLQEGCRVNAGIVGCKGTVGGGVCVMDQNRCSRNHGASRVRHSTADRTASSRLGERTSGAKCKEDKKSNNRADGACHRTNRKHFELSHNNLLKMECRRKPLWLNNIGARSHGRPAQNSGQVSGTLKIPFIKLF